MLHACMKDLEVPVCFRVLNALYVNILPGTTYINRYVRHFLLSSGESPLGRSRPLYISVVGHENEELTRWVVANEILTVTTSPN